MNQGPLIFLGVFFTLASSWVGMIVAPQLQFGKQQPVVLRDTELSYPQARPGLAQQGAEVYRANGCVYCHTQQARQADLKFGLYLVKPGTNKQDIAQAVVEIRGTNKAEVAKTVAQIQKGEIPREVTRLIGTAPVYLQEDVPFAVAQAGQEKLKAAGAESIVSYLTHGPDIERHWGVRAMVAQDYLLDQPPMIGDVRVGPDLSNVATRKLNRTWLLWLLYNPHLGRDTAGEVSEGGMPAYPYLFKKQKIGRKPSPDALHLPLDYAPEAGYEIVPKPEAQALVAYLMSLKSEASLEEAPSPQTLPTAESLAAAAPPAPVPNAPTKP